MTGELPRQIVADQKIGLESAHTSIQTMAYHGIWAGGPLGGQSILVNLTADPLGVGLQVAGGAGSYTSPQTRSANSWIAMQATQLQFIYGPLLSASLNCPGHLGLKVAGG